MPVLLKSIKCSSLFLLAVFILQGCESNFKKVQTSNLVDFVPSGEAETFNFKYTDSGRITAILVSPLMKEFANLAFPFTDFPKGIDLTLYDKNKKRTVILADYATSYKLTNIIELVGNVKISSQDGQILETDKLFYDQNNQWFYTEDKFKFTDLKGVSNGKGIDFSKDFKEIHSQKIYGELESDE